jgi:hypothetical protein
MKTFTTTIQKPLLEIYFDNDAESPRKWDGNIGYFFTKEQRHNSPDGTKGEIYNIVIETSHTASNEQDHIVEMTRRIKAETNEEVVVIYPVYRYEHGDSVYRRGTAQGFDVSNCGFYIVTDKTLKEYGEHAKPIEALIDGELEIYTQWVNGEVYGFKLVDQDGNDIDACGGFYGLEDLRNTLPKEWQKENLSDYLRY